MADRILHRIAGRHGVPIDSAYSGKRAGFFRDLNACRLAQAKFSGILIHFFNADLISGLKEEVVARNLDGMHNADIAMRACAASEL